MTSPNTSYAQQRVTVLQKQLSSLHAQLSALRANLDTTAQALKIEQSNQDPEIEALVHKWRLVTREAAEELFASARDRVNRMGGVGVWREKMRQSKLRKAEWDTCGGADGGEDADGSDVEREKEARRREIEDGIDAGGRGDSDREEHESEKGDDETFTMDMMLKNLNIDLKMIGFDKENQRWID
ncbi:predicted protein [Uncinocarpus reesii 1704]|uniref:Uncharacterized protein n=1 Tax=Uncinocarpus reesii (strain UAMH 1704) TaxID=336963 RepID=C4JY50_UNCRE|nr:uncharacterized protein UREG_07101 [Uncinocarpus reesii 1704]EEP82236.1 predicted protein [Uncinocarpus reesii 1704]